MAIILYSYCELRNNCEPTVTSLMSKEIFTIFETISTRRYTYVPMNPKCSLHLFLLLH